MSFGRSKSLLVATFLAVALCASNIVADEGFYFGYAYTLANEKIEYTKDVRNSSGSGYELAGQSFSGREQSRTYVPRNHLFAGWHLPRHNGTRFIDFQFELAKSSGIDGRFEGVTDQDGINEFGENWPETWEVETGVEMAGSLRLGRYVERDYIKGLYGILGYRTREIEFHADFAGCFTVEPCSPSELRSDSISIPDRQHAVFYGLGIAFSKGIELEITNRIDRALRWYSDFSDGGHAVSVVGDVQDQNIDLTIKVRSFPWSKT